MRNKKVSKLKLICAVGYFVASVLWALNTYINTVLISKICGAIASVCFIVCGIIWLHLYIDEYKAFKRKTEQEELGYDTDGDF